VPDHVTEPRFTASFIRGPIADPGFYAFTRYPYETCSERRDEKVGKQVQAMRIYEETGNT